LSDRREKMLLKYVEKKKLISRLDRIIDRVLDGASEAQACREEGVSLTWFRRFTEARIFGGDIKEDEIRLKMGEADNSWRHKFVLRVYGERIVVLEDFDDAFSYALNKYFDEREKDCMYLRYRDCMTLDEIGRKHGICRERVRQILKRCSKKLRESDTFRFFKYGLECVQYEYIKDSVPETDIPKEKVVRSVFGVEVEELGFSYRTYNVLKRNRLDTVGDIVNRTLAEIKMMRGCGRKSLAEIRDKMVSLGFDGLAPHTRDFSRE